MRGVEAELVHDPAGLDAVGGSAPVEDERLAHADDGAAAAAAAHLAVLARGLPVARLGGAVGARPRRVLAVPEAEEVPLGGRQLRHLCEFRSILPVNNKRRFQIDRFDSDSICIYVGANSSLDDGSRDRWSSLI